MLFPAHLQARELCPQSLLLALELSQVTHIPASIKTGRAYNPERSTLPDDCVMTLVFQDGLPSSTLTNKVHSCKLYTHKTRITFNELENLVSVCNCFVKC